jgi:SAM-dependent methyltransferase
MAAQVLGIFRPATEEQDVRRLYRAIVPAPIRRSAPVRRARHMLRQARAAIGERPPPPPNVVYSDFNEMLHRLRTAELHRMPRSRVLLSAGCAGLWYFDWIDQAYGRLDMHIGVERYLPRPEGLPANVRWVENTVADMSGVDDSSVDLVFSGQNFEHLWPDELAGFVTEAARVLRPGGSLVIDSPNRLATTRLSWSHPEHTVEWTAEEAKALVTAAGFEVTGLRGLWLVIDPRDDSVLGLYPQDPLATPAVLERIHLASADLDRSFVWWLEARRAERAPDRAAVADLCDSVFAAAWPERTARSYIRAGKLDADGSRLHVPAGTHGVVLHGPNFPLPAGEFEAVFRLRADDRATGPVARVDVFSGATTFAERTVDAGDLAGDGADVAVPFALPDTTFAVELRLFATAGASFDIDLPVQLRDTSGAVASRGARAATARR